MRKVAEKLAELLKQPTEGLPDTVVLHALVAGFDVETPITDPNAFFTYFVSPMVQVKTRFIGLHAPAIVRPEQMGEFLTLPGIKEACQHVNELDIIVTSAAVMSDEHSMLYRYYINDSPQTVERLRHDGCIGDMLWLPLARHGPVDSNKYPYRSMTIIELGMLPSYIRRGAQVLLALGPCGRCNHLKTEILNAILNLGDHLITHLVVDSRTARGLFEGLPQ